MSDFHFTPTEEQKARIQPPYYEDARADFAPYYDPVDWTILKAKEAVLHELAKLGAGEIQFHEGFFGTGSAKRYGYLITFRYGGMRGQLTAAGLPMRSSATDKKITAIRIQALRNVRDWIKASVTAQVFAPHSDILLQYLLVDGKRTVGDMMRETGRVPLLEEGALDGEIVEEGR